LPGIFPIVAFIGSLEKAYGVCGVGCAPGLGNHPPVIVDDMKVKNERVIPALIDQKLPATRREVAEVRIVVFVGVAARRPEPSSPSLPAAPTYHIPLIRRRRKKRKLF
jgi:hypothetical protein